MFNKHQKTMIKYMHTRNLNTDFFLFGIHIRFFFCKLADQTIFMCISRSKNKKNEKKMLIKIRKWAHIHFRGADGFSFTSLFFFFSFVHPFI